MSEEKAMNHEGHEVSRRFCRSAERAAIFLPSVSLLFLLCLAPAELVQARTKSASVTVNGDYVFALATANRFLSAWQNQDRENGLVMLTDAAKEGKSEDQLGDFFSPGDGAAYEIGRGRKLTAGRYSFPVTLLEASRWRVHPRLSQVVVVRSGRDWAIDRVP